MPFRIIVVLIGEIGGAIAATISPYLGVLMLLFLNFGRPQDDRPNVEPLHIPMVFTLAVSVGLLFRLAGSMPDFFAALKKLRIILLFYALMLVSGILHWTELSKNRLDDFSTLMCFCVMSLMLVKTPKQLRGYLNAMLFSGAYVAIRALRNPSSIVEHIAGQEYERAAIAKGGTVFGNSNYLALFMVLTIFLSITMMSFYKKTWQRILLLLVTSGAGYVFFKANSRGASIALGLGMLVLWVLSKQKLKAAVALVLLLSVAAVVAPESYWSRLSTVSTYQEDASAMDRLQLWNIALDLIPQHPVFGIGPDNFVLYAPNTPHNAYLQVSCEIGIPALLLYVAILLTGLYASVRARKVSLASHGQTAALLQAASLGVFCCVLAVTVQGFTTGLAHREIVYVFVTMAVMIRGFAENLSEAVEPAKPSSVITKSSELVGSPLST
ncbi:MAG TPA: O-antigen ligase family protein [Terriglobales bacterium]|nr:O-antigen ligase family protein [Terriglobales bacterium]